MTSAQREQEFLLIVSRMCLALSSLCDVSSDVRRWLSEVAGQAGEAASANDEPARLHRVA